MRKFAKVKNEFIMYGQDPNNIKMPVRKTKHSVCYDCYSPIDTDIESGETKLIFTNVKAYCNSDEGFILASTSGLGKKGIILANGIGIVESDYADNEGNDGNIGFMLHNIGKDKYHVNAGDKIGQLFFFKFLTIDDEEEITTVRKGGFGSTGMK
jgi:dUTP pyrophosphatase